MRSGRIASGDRQKVGIMLNAACIGLANCRWHPESLIAMRDDAPSFSVNQPAEVQSDATDYSAEPPNDATPSRGFSLASLMLIVALLAVVLTAFHAHVAIGIAATIYLTPALLRTIVRIQNRKQLGIRTSPLRMLTTFLASIGVVVAGAVTWWIPILIVAYGGTAVFERLTPDSTFEIIASGSLFIAIPAGLGAGMCLSYRVMKYLTPDEVRKD
jgi:hypothetical protein